MPAFTSGQTREQEYAGKIIKCPFCGENLPSFTEKCPSCGHEIRGAGATRSICELSYKLEHTSSDSEKANIIRMHAIPNTREDILEFMILSSTNMENSYQPEISQAWSVKFEQAYEKSKLLFGDDQLISNYYNQYLSKKEQNQQREKQEQKRARTERRNSKIINFFGNNINEILPIGMLVVLILIIILLSGASSISHMMKEHQLENLAEETQTYIEDGDFEMARITANKIIDDSGWSDESKQKWDSIRESLLESIIRQEVLLGKKIYVGITNEEIKGKNYSETVDYFEQQGFTDIQTEKIEDLVTGWLVKDGEVEEVTIDGLSSFEEESVFEPDAKIVIYYHTFDE